ncbi:hypothetical protein [Methanomethylovorans sp.]
MKHLKECPECKTLLRDVYQNMQHCVICGYRTFKGTARLDTLRAFA